MLSSTVEDFEFTIFLQILQAIEVELIYLKTPKYSIILFEILTSLSDFYRLKIL